MGPLAAAAGRMNCLNEFLSAEEAYISLLKSAQEVRQCCFDDFLSFENN